MFQFRILTKNVLTKLFDELLILEEKENLGQAGKEI